jgi:hypothetical protein
MRKINKHNERIIEMARLMEGEITDRKQLREFYRSFIVFIRALTRLSKSLKDYTQRSKEDCIRRCKESLNND